GYSTFSETCRMRVPLVSLTRRDFAEAAILLEGIANYAEHQILEPDDFFHGDWDFLRQPVQPPRLAQTLPADGNETIATAIVNYIG
ncbi:MAG: glycosyl transferase, partial [Cyanobacteriota bacterium SKYGB_h_bin112]|nr:glycosyl transferase [Cyanobacteriota bacterium SKYGB_h_bin112]